MNTAMVAPSPGMAPRAAMELLRGIVELDAGEPSHPAHARHCALAERAYPALWRWAREEPAEVRRLGESLSNLRFPGDIKSLAGFCMLAGVHHDPASPPMPFDAATLTEFIPDGLGGATLRTSTTLRDAPDNFAPSPWPNVVHWLTAQRAFQFLIETIPIECDPRVGFLSAPDALSRYGLLASDPKTLPGPHLPATLWQEMARAAEEAGLRSTLARSIPPADTGRSASL